ncbi:radical SAM/SPASM domain-containing protein [Clostridium beijerinckii]|uniref:S-adenosyl-L-methionine-dependent 2-deoxy-scyllo-inosamine dehydrogenase n=1 Tax=Clostridium beijerinckii TaxID=1520 RepID=A0A1S8S625_CLOBE|nr:radical SAM/SPASM domain-containing protein [Clostridium beijerinckii]NRY60052.1 radical SAM protein with 4Fe4S-binding SPASM domain [Clostridium beijerinckii]OOM60908.1 S-adenosyl-L-methionine-dependent 2-deoxy-scyllo-inosamine dehydrogenase [Clostridium beijerinckii]
MIYISYGSTENKNTDLQLLRRRDNNSEIFLEKILNTYIENDMISPLNTVEIETVNRCNNDCSFCPVNRNIDKRKMTIMDEDLFYSIIKQLEEIDYSGVISLFSNNEPLIDKRIIKFIKYAKEKLPNAQHWIYTNGLLLDEDTFEQLIENLDYMVIDNYNDDMVLLPNIKEIYDKFKERETKCNVMILVRKKNQVLDTRGGNAPNRSNDIIFNSKCVLPFIQMVIRPDGKVSKCCQDAVAATTVGDLAKESIMEVWSGKIFRQYRQTLFDQGRNGIKGCNTCDAFGLWNYIPSEWIGKALRIFVDIIAEKRKNRKIYLYEFCKETKHTAQILLDNGIKVDGIIGKCDENVFKGIPIMDMNDVIVEEGFVVFPFDTFEVINKLEENNLVVGKDFIIYRPLTLQHAPFDIVDNDENKNVYGNLKNFYGKLLNKKIIIFGTGMASVNVIEKLSLNAEYFLDNNSNKWGEKYYNTNIFNPKKVLEEHEGKIIIVVASQHYESIKNQLVEMGVSEDKILDGLKYIE